MTSCLRSLRSRFDNRWEPLEHPPAPGQWAYFSMAEEAGEGGEDQNVSGGKN